MTPDQRAAALRLAEGPRTSGELWRRAVISLLRELAAEPVNPAPGYCKHCKQYTIEEPLPAEPVQGVRHCTCHPDDNPPKPCPRQYALAECRKAAAEPVQGPCSFDEDYS